jgi:hypothetical protein
MHALLQLHLLDAKCPLCRNCTGGVPVCFAAARGYAASAAICIEPISAAWRKERMDYSLGRVWRMASHAAGESYLDNN